MNVAERICRAPVGLAAIVMAIMSAAAWGNLTLLQRGALAQVEAEIRPLVSGLTALGNLLSATTVLAFWPLLTLAFWCCGILAAGAAAPDYRELLGPVGAAHIPAAAGTLGVWLVLLAADVWIMPGEDMKELAAMPFIQTCRTLTATGNALTAVAFVLVVRRSFGLSWVRAAAVVVAPFCLYGLCARLIG